MRRVIVVQPLLFLVSCGAPSHADAPTHGPESRADASSGSRPPLHDGVGSEVVSPVHATSTQPSAQARAPSTKAPSVAPPPSPPRPGEAAPSPPKPHAVHPEPGALAGITEEHNRVRRGLGKGLPPLKWSVALARSAQSHASKIAARCILQHSGKPLGENLFGGSSASPRLVMDTWAGEVKDYNAQTGSCSGVCGHYTQVVWRDTTEVGCGAASCANGMELWVCNYNPPGNYRGEKPY